MQYNDLPTLATLLIVLGILFVVFLFSRALMLWYYKIDLRLAEQKRTNFLFEKFLQHQGIDFSEEENNTTVTVRIKESGKVITVGYKAWEKMKEEYGEDTYEVI